MLGECECALRCLAVVEGIRSSDRLCCVGVGVHCVTLLARLTQVAGSDTPAASLVPSVFVAGEKNPVSASRVRGLGCGLSANEGWAIVALSAIIMANSMCCMRAVLTTDPALSLPPAQAYMLSHCKKSCDACEGGKNAAGRKEAF